MATTAIPTGQQNPATTATTPPGTPASTPASTQTAAPTGVGGTASTIQSAAPTSTNNTNATPPSTDSASPGCCAQMKNFFQSIIDRVWGAVKGFGNWVKSFFVAAETTPTPTPTPVLTQVEGLRNYISPEANHTVEDTRLFFNGIPQADQQQIRQRMAEIAVAGNATFADAIRNDAEWANRVIRGTEQDGSALPQDRADLAAHVQILGANSSFRQAVNDVIGAQAAAAALAAQAAAAAAAQTAATQPTAPQTGTTQTAATQPTAPQTGTTPTATT